jgi:hypothetical protein
LLSRPVSGIVHPIPIPKPTEWFFLRESNNHFGAVGVFTLSLKSCSVAMDGVPVTFQLEEINSLHGWHVPLVASALRELGVNGLVQEKG